MSTQDAVALPVRESEILWVSQESIAKAFAYILTVRRSLTVCFKQQTIQNYFKLHF